MKTIKWEMYNLKKLVVKHIFIFSTIVIVVVSGLWLGFCHWQEERLIEATEVPIPVSVPKPTNQPDVEGFKSKPSQATRLDDSQMNDIIKQINKELNK
jgi:hypothetical protein